MRKERGESIPIIDLKKQYRLIDKEIKEAALKVFKKGSFILGENVVKFEEEVARYCHLKYALGVASGTDALILSLAALGIKAQDEVITSPFTFISTAESISKVRAKAVFADIDPETFNLNPKEVKDKITKKTKAIIPVHLYGQPCDMKPIIKLADKYGLYIIEDAAQAFGAEYCGKKTGSLGDTGIFSFFPTKIMGAFGDAGMIVMKDKKVYDKISMLRVHGSKGRYHHVLNGYNSRLDELQAAILRVKFRYLEKWIDRRREIADFYNESFKNLKGKVIIPYEAKGTKHVYNIYTIRTPLRDKLQVFLEARGIMSIIYYPISLHLQVVYKNLGYKKGDFPEAEKASREVISLPIYPEMSKKQQNLVVKTVLEFFKR